ncbi:MAG: aminoacyl-tRNA hydrolase [Alphaproteobacteria bacterium]|nr:aminoacyl-tRNA hydrolase [Alphaproteobacteria bacterium]
MFVLVGLGNPGTQYAMNRHNIGFMVIDTIAESFNFPAFKAKFSSMISEGQIGQHRVILCKPSTYMNLSGGAVGPLIRFYKIPPESVYVVHDDLDLDPGRVKLKMGGGTGGHNGLASLDQHLGKNYWHLRLGIGHPGHKDAVSSYVLSNFKSDEQNWLIPLLTTINEQIEDLFGSDPSMWLNKLNTKLKG